MYKHLLVPTDGSNLSLKAAKTAAGLAKGLGAKITAVYVIPPYSPPMGGDGMMYYPEAFSPTDYRKTMEATAGKALAKVKAAADAAGVPCKVASVQDPLPWQAIIKAARSHKCDLIVMASHGRKGLQSLLLGSETSKVLTHSKTPVLVCR